MYRTATITRVMFALCLPMVVCVGCGSGNMGSVTGTVTADGKPLAGAVVTFSPQPEGRPSSGRTDDNGKYELIYSRSEKGAVIGEHIVRITTADEGGDYGKPIPETLPAKYNVRSELKEQVAAGKNVIDFQLDYEGKVVQPGY